MRDTKNRKTDNASDPAKSAKPGVVLGRRSSRRGSFREGPMWVPGDPEAVRPVVRGETYPLFVGGVLLAFVALFVCYSRGYLLLYGDAVAHLAIARRILDARWPGLAQLGGVWLPLPHVLMLPFIMNLQMWQTGLAATPMSALSFAVSVAGIWRLARRLMRLRWALVATAFYAFNPNLLFLSTTAMTEALFLALLVWSVVATMEGVAALRVADLTTARARMMLAGLLVLGQVFTRYDGWIIGAAVWCCFAWAVWKSDADTRRRMRPWLVVFTLLCVAGPLLWFWYNAHFEGDWLDFMRGPYSAKVIERKTAPPGQHYRGWHNLGWALLFYTRTAQVDAAAWETGFGLMLAALYGVWLQLRPTSQNRDRGHPREMELGRPTPQNQALVHSPKIVATSPKSPQIGVPHISILRCGPEQNLASSCLALLLWVPLPFYVYSVAYGSVPIFIPQLWPHSFYNARYGMGMLPALAVYAALAGERLDVWLRASAKDWAKLAARFWQPVAMMLCVLNAIAMMYEVPPVLKEGMVNARTRMALERQLALSLEQMPLNVPVMMALSAHVGAVQQAGRPLVSMVSENDSQTFDKALADPAHSAAYIIAIAGDPVARAVAEHPEGLEPTEVICTTGQPCARIYQSKVWRPSGSGSKD